MQRQMKPQRNAEKLHASGGAMALQRGQDTCDGWGIGRNATEVERRDECGHKRRGAHPCLPPLGQVLCGYGWTDSPRTTRPVKHWPTSVPVGKPPCLLCITSTCSADVKLLQWKCKRQSANAATLGLHAHNCRRHEEGFREARCTTVGAPLPHRNSDRRTCQK